MAVETTECWRRFHGPSWSDLARVAETADDATTTSRIAATTDSGLLKCNAWVESSITLCSPALDASDSHRCKPNQIFSLAARSRGVSQVLIADVSRDRLRTTRGRLPKLRLAPLSCSREAHADRPFALRALHVRGVHGKEPTMPDGLKQTGKPDDYRINVDQEHEVRTGSESVALIGQRRWPG